jgi:CHAD domain-containing protein
VAPPSAALAEELKRAFASLGDSRDDDVLTLEIAPRLIQAGMPALTLPAQDKPVSCDSAAATARSPALQTALLHVLRELIAAPVAAGSAVDAPVSAAAGAPVEASISVGAGPSPNASAQRADKLLIERLNRWRRKLARQGVNFRALPIEVQHDLRKKAKALRYCLDMCASLAPRRDLQAVSKALGHIQDVLGDLNDYYVAQNYYASAAQEDPQAWFAIGWLRAMQIERQTQAQTAFAQMKKLSLGK